MDERSTDDSRRVLLVEDDGELAEMLVALFAAEGYPIDHASDGQRGLHFGLTRQYRLIVVDRGLPGMDGLEVVARLRQRAVSARVLMLTALGDTADLVAGLDAGADDYLAKPFEIAELLARVRALSRRPVDDAEVIPLGAARLDMALRGAHLPNGEFVSLSGREFALIRSLATRPRAVHSRAQLRGRIFHGADSESIVDTYVHYLRRKLGPGIVRTIHGLGYQIGAL
ncbi:response regulator transcription factor [Phytohabitans aurantiacus]|uniref:Transcriptional regulator n=1 Tax=Phytohabitans aurantiacus TaxID=3016789 RepID=A0ABQ5R5P4_9ACTN|nr:response regulator transcription factor [Phytohabitans aurantiacus]GLI00876.1 transcriptional regulator [Phytohabitans aurantiacus]